jgi:hypothetical protein
MINLIVILSRLLISLTACNQNNTNPNNNTTSCTTVNSNFCEINFNGTTLQSEGYDYNGMKGAVNCGFQPSGISAGYTNFSLVSPYICSAGNSIGNLNITLFSAEKSGQATTGVYNTNTSCVITDCTNLTPKFYPIKDSSLIVNINNITSTNVSGTFTCIVKDATNQYPANGSFNALRTN